MTPKDTSYNEIGPCAQNIKSTYGFSIEHNWEGLCDHLKEKILTLTSYNFPSPVLNLDTETYVFHNCSLDETILKSSIEVST
jgi:hypothetical protein